jgi:hypothetical protein
MQTQLTQTLESLRRIATERRRGGKKEMGGLKEFQTEVEKKCGDTCYEQGIT